MKVELLIILARDQQVFSIIMDKYHGNVYWIIRYKVYEETGTNQNKSN